ncbi:lysophospholipid acyltransferase family protein [Maricaulis sp. CAU 1757]
MRVLQSFVLYVWMFGLMVVMGGLGLPLLLAPRRWMIGFMRIYLKLLWLGMRVIYGVTFEVRGRENLPTGGALIASKHMSMWETLAFWDILPDPAIILKKSLVYFPIFGWYAVRLGNISIDRAGGSKALKQMLRDARKRAGEGRQVLIFPEGTRVAPREHPEFKPGIAGLYGAMNVPCVPVALNSGVFLKSYCGLKRPGRVIVEFLEPIPPGLDKRAFLDTLHTRINEASDALLPPGH